MRDELIGSTFDGRFHVERLLGSGGMGSVYLVEHEVLQRRFALKVLHRDLLQDAQLAQMFRREARAASRVQHPNVTFVFDYSQTDDGVPYIVMEYVKGTTVGRELRDLKRQGQFLPLGRALDILAQVADALGAAHACGVVHRDLKPANIALTSRRGREDFVKVLDFGLAKLARGTTTLNTNDQRSIFGTPEYMSPEQSLEDDTLVDHRSDLYGLGIVAYKLLSGEPPFVGEPLQVLWAHQENAPRRLSEALGTRRQIPPPLDQLVARCLRKRIAERPESAAEVANELRTIAMGIPGLGGEIRAAELGASTFFGVSVGYVMPQLHPGLTGPMAPAPAPQKTVVSPVGLMGRTEHPVTRDPQSHALEDLVQLVRGRGMGSENTVHLLSRMLEADDELARYEQEYDLLQGQIVHLEIRVSERSARLREALVQLEHEMARQRERTDFADSGAAEHQVERLHQRAGEVAERLRGLEEAFDDRLEQLETGQRAIAPLLEQQREDAQHLREHLLRQLREMRRQGAALDDETIAAFISAGI